MCVRARARIILGFPRGTPTANAEGWEGSEDDERMEGSEDDEGMEGSEDDEGMEGSEDDEVNITKFVDFNIEMQRNHISRRVKRMKMI